MPKLRVETLINAPIQVCFDAARNIEMHEQTCLNTREKAVAGVTTGCIGHNETVTFEAVHLGIKQRLTSKIINFDPPNSFTDEMQKGAFKRLRHDHIFKARDGGTLMIDVLEFESPLGFLGAMVDRIFLAGYMKRFLERRNEKLKELIETNSE